MASDRKIPDHVARLLVSSIESVERLDVLLHLRATREKAYSARAVASVLRMSTRAAEQHLAILCGRGFLTVSIGSDLIYAYEPVSPAIDAVLGEVDELNRARRGDLVAALQDGPTR